MSWFGTKESNEPSGPTFFPLPSNTSGFGKLDKDDTAWKTISGHGFQTETHTYYSLLEDGSFLMVQVIWSFLGVFLIPATTQMTFKLYNPHTKKTSWKSVNVNGFKHDGCSSKSDAFEIKHTGTPETEESYAITAHLDKNVQINITFTKPADAPGAKYGTGEQAGYSNFGSNDPTKRDAFVIHRFLPLMTTSGSLIIDGAIVDAKGEAMFVHAMQSGMRPNLIASSWNFAFFASNGGNEESELGSVRAIQMEFTTTDDYGPKGKNSGRSKVNIGFVYASKIPNNALLVVGQTHAPEAGEYTNKSKDIVIAEHLTTEKDEETSYMAPHGLSFVWEGDRVDGAGRARVSAMNADVWSGLIEKVDVLAEIPYVIRKGLSAVTGAKPFIFQYHNPSTLNVEIEGKAIPVKGWMFNEASFVSM
ncbi:putative cell survival pathways protein [Apiotrichum porosum]|uniref:Putative cell survival pathways protein n=1 Tax=Apiotrichum porosum TaxID=105984 RepID=A0A427XMD3_9TREE|nr:putative cell survival pathways protein [Apiotrichum porosum]RSH79877.1 putative cell survival pathways protein [Apiotrichum porosum]